MNPWHFPDDSVVLLKEFSLVLPKENSVSLSKEISVSLPKDNFKHKAGYFYSDGTQGKCFVFANEDAYNRWAASEGKDESEILGSFGITENYRANINVDGFSSNKSAASGSKGNTIDFN